MSLIPNIRSMINERASPTEISASPIRTLAFAADGKHLVSGDKEAVRVWRMADNQLVETMKAKDVRSVAVSKDDKWIAAGESWGKMTVWDRETSKEVLTHDDGHTVTSVDFSPDSKRLVVASGSRAAVIFDLATRKTAVGPLVHPYWIVAAKFSPQGNHLATATFLRDSVRVYDSHSGSLLADITEKVTPFYNTGLLWSSNSESIFVVSQNTATSSSPQSNPPQNAIKQIDVRHVLTTSPPTGQALDRRPHSLAEWSVPPDTNYPCIVSSRSGEIIMYSAAATVTLCDTLQRTQHSLIQLSQDANSIALSPDGRSLAIGGEDGKIAFKSLPRSSRHRHLFSEWRQWAIDNEKNEHQTRD